MAEGKTTGGKSGKRKRQILEMEIPPQMRRSEWEPLTPGSVPRPPPHTPEAEAELSPDDDWEETWGLDSDSDGSDGKPPSKEKVIAKPFVSWSSHVTKLNGSNYYDFIARMEKCLVMFHNPFQCESVFPRLQFREAALTTHGIGHKFAAVDCTEEKALCLQEQILKTPVYKLYSNGFSLSTIKEADKMNADQLRMLVVMTPVLHQPRLELGKEFLTRSSSPTILKHK